MTELKVYLGGEGANELGSYLGAVSYYDELKPGVIVALLRQVQSTGWRVVGARKWSQIRKLKAHGPSPNEERNVRALILHAQEARADVLAFTRDSDGDRARVEQIEQAISEHEPKGEKPAIVGGAAIPVLEAWLLALDGERGTEQLSKVAAQNRFEEKYHFAKDTEQVVAHVERANLRGIPADASGLVRWVKRAAAVLAPAP